MVVDEEVARLLGVAERWSLRLFVASCSERFSQVFCALRADDPARVADVGHFIDSLEDLWDAQSLPAEFSARRLELVAFPELQPNELGFVEVEDIYAFYSVLVMMYATESVVAGSSDSAMRCAHAALTAMGQLDRNLAIASFVESEKSRQLEVIENLVALDDRMVPIGEIRATDQAISLGRAEVILTRVQG